jgi:hypothetical protein
MIFDLYAAHAFMRDSIESLTHGWDISAVAEHQNLILAIVKANCELWRQEDLAREAGDDTQRGIIKTTIDKLNQQRNDAIQQFDQWFSAAVNSSRSICHNNRLYTETVGSVVDRLSILLIRQWHLQHKADHVSINSAVGLQLSELRTRCRAQLDYLRQAGQQMVNAYFAGEAKPVNWQHLKLYNDPELRS